VTSGPFQNREWPTLNDLFSAIVFRRLDVLGRRDHQLSELQFADSFIDLLGRLQMRDQIDDSSDQLIRPRTAEPIKASGSCEIVFKGRTNDCKLSVLVT
jgi:hypothetical protein